LTDCHHVVVGGPPVDGLAIPLGKTRQSQDGAAGGKPGGSQRTDFQQISSAQRRLRHTLLLLE
jgi:hypothetical protein